MRHTQHTLGTPLSVFPGCVGYCAWGARSTLRKPTYQHIFGSGETGVSAFSALTPLVTPLYLSVRICGYMVLVKTGRERKLPVHARQDT